MNKLVKGVTLIELILVVTVLAILVVAMTGAINPIALIGRANDSRRKKDLGRIKVSFEDYYNDKYCYPPQDVINELMNQANCGKNIFAPWMNSWPCDPVTKQPYYIVIYQSSDNCPKWFKVYANLENKNDNDIPDGWYEHPGSFLFADGNLSVDDTNYGISSTNVNWYDYDLAECDGVCMVHDVINEGSCGAPGVDGCVDNEDRWCYISSKCKLGCRVESCNPL